MSFIYDFTDTWNNGDETFNSIKLNVTDTASADDSLLVNLQVNDEIVFTVDKNGQIGSKDIFVSYLLKWGVITPAIATVARSSNVATVTTSVAHALLVGQKIEVNATTDNTFDATGASIATILSVPDSTSFTYASTGSDKSQTADSGTLTTWELVADASHAPTYNARITAIAAGGVTVTWTNPAGTWKVASGTFGNHQNNANAILTPFNTAVGTGSAGIALRSRQTLFGRAVWNGTTTGGGITTNGNWTKEGDTGSITFVDSTVKALFVGHSSNSLPTSGSRGVASFPLPKLQSVSDAVRLVLPNYSVSPFTADAYRPSATGFYCQLLGSAGTILSQSEIEALSPASSVQLMWERTVDTVIQDHTVPPSAVTVFQMVHLTRV